MIDAVNFLVILGMAAVTYLCRSLGYLIMGYVPLTQRVRRGLEALPGAVVVSIIVPGAVAAGPSGLLAVLTGMLTMWVSRRDLLGLMVGCATAVIARNFGL